MARRWVSFNSLLSSVCRIVSYWLHEISAGARRVMQCESHLPALFFRKSTDSLAAFVTFIVLAVGLASCGKTTDTPQGHVTGNVSFKGQPVTEGMVFLLSKATGRSASANLAGDGHFVIKEGVNVGKYTVSIIPPVIESNPGNGPEPPPKEYPNIPKKYRSDTTSDLFVEVVAGENEFSWDLKE